MLSNFSIPKLLNDMKLVVQKNHFGGEILAKTPVGPKK